MAAGNSNKGQGATTMPVSGGSPSGKGMQSPVSSGVFGGKGRQTAVPNLFQSAQAQGLQNLYRPFGGGYHAGNPVPPLFGGGNPVQAAQQRQQAQQQATRAQQNRAVKRFQPNFIFRRDS